MKVAIITRENYRSPRFLAEGLSNMLKQIDIVNDIHYRGIEQLELACAQNAGLKIAAKSTVAKLLLNTWKKYDLFIISDTVGILAQEQIINTLRKLNKPVALYEVFYPGGAQYWLDRLPFGSLDLFDAYFTTTPVNDTEPVGVKPVYNIGININHRPPFSTQKSGEFTALMDFSRPGYEDERNMQLKALKELEIKTIHLEGEYTFDEISRIYDQANVYFVAFPEAFGVPIVQLQNSGAYIASPSTDWVKRHANGHEKLIYGDFDKHQFSENFIFYNSYQELLISLEEIRENYKSVDVQNRFSHEQPYFKYGDTKTLSRAIVELME
jgi:hypothetical protein